MSRAESRPALCSEGQGPTLGLPSGEQEGIVLLGGHWSFALLMQSREQQTSVKSLAAQNEQLALLSTLLIALFDIQNCNIPLG